jgi:hypothetical protein
MDMARYARSRFLKVEDVASRPVTLTITAVTEGKNYSGDAAPQLAFSEDPRQLTLNPTNTKTLVKQLGRDSEKWIGKRVELYAEEDRLRVREVAVPVPAGRVRVEERADVEEIPF